MPSAHRLELHGLRSVCGRTFAGHPDMPLKITDSMQATDIPNQPARNLACNRCFG